MPEDPIERLERKVDSFVMVQRNKRDTVWRLAGAAVLIFAVGVVVGAVLQSAL